MSTDPIVVDSFLAAREAACQKVGFLRSVIIKTESREWEIPNPSLLSYEQRKRVSALDVWVQTTDEIDRWNDTEDKNGNKIKGAPKLPWRKDNVPLEDDYDAKLVKALFGDKLFATFIKDGGNPSDIELIWTQMQEHMAARKKADSKSGPGDQPVAAVSDAD